MAHTKTNTKNETKILTTSWRNRHLDKLYVCVFRKTNNGNANGSICGNGNTDNCSPRNLSTIMFSTPTIVLLDNRSPAFINTMSIVLLFVSMWRVCNCKFAHPNIWSIFGWVIDEYRQIRHINLLKIYLEAFLGYLQILPRTSKHQIGRGYMNEIHWKPLIYLVIKYISLTYKTRPLKFLLMGCIISRWSRL